MVPLVETDSGLVMLLLLLILGGLLVFLGWQLALQYLRDQRDVLLVQRQALDAEWRALENTRQVRGVFLDARRSMQRDADVRQRFRWGE